MADFPARAKSEYVVALERDVKGAGDGSLAELTELSITLDKNSGPEKTGLPIDILDDQQTTQFNAFVVAAKQTKDEKELKEFLAKNPEILVHAFGETQLSLDNWKAVASGADARRDRIE